MARPRLDITDEERKARLNKQKYEYLKKYLKTDEGKVYRRKMEKNRQEKNKQNRELVKQQAEIIKELQAKLEQVDREPPMLGHDSGNFQLKNE